MMRKLLTLLFFLLAFPAFAQRITVKLYVTNQPAQGAVFTLNGSSRNWTTNPIASTDLLITNTTQASAYVVWANAIADSFGASINYTTATNSVTFTGGANVTITTNGVYIPWGNIIVITNATTADVGVPVLVGSNTVVLQGQSTSLFISNLTLLGAAGSALGYGGSAVTNGLATTNFVNATVGTQASGGLSAVLTNGNSTGTGIVFSANSVLAGYSHRATFSNTVTKIEVGSQNSNLLEIVNGTTNQVATTSTNQIPISALNTNGATAGSVPTYNGTNPVWQVPPTAIVDTNIGTGVAVYRGVVTGSNQFAGLTTANSSKLAISASGGNDLFAIGSGVWFDGESGHTIANPMINGGTVNLAGGNTFVIADSLQGYTAQILYPSGASSLVVSNVVGLNSVNFVGFGSGLQVNGAQVLTTNYEPNVSRVINIRDYGATGTTNADSAAAINSAVIALASMPSSNRVRTLKIPYGLYGLSTAGTNTLTSRNPIFFDLSGIGGTVVVDADPGATFWITGTNLENYSLPFGGVMEGAVMCLSSNAVVKNLTIQGTGVQTNNSAVFMSGIRITGGGNLTFDGVTVKNMPGKGWSPVLDTNDNNSASVMATGANTLYHNCSVISCGNIAQHNAGNSCDGITILSTLTTVDGCTFSNIVGSGVALYYTYGNSNSLTHEATRNSSFDATLGNSSSPEALTVENLNFPDSSNEVASDIEVSGCKFRWSGSATNQGHEAMLTLLGGDPGSGVGPQLMMSGVRVCNNDFSTATPSGASGPDGGLDIEGRVTGITISGNTESNLVYGYYINNTHSTNGTYALTLEGNSGIGGGFAYQLAGVNTNLTIGHNSAAYGGGWSIGNSTNVNFVGGDYSLCSTGFYITGSVNIQCFNPTNSDGSVIGSLTTFGATIGHSAKMYRTSNGPGFSTTATNTLTYDVVTNGDTVLFGTDKGTGCITNKVAGHFKICGGILAYNSGNLEYMNVCVLTNGYWCRSLGNGLAANGDNCAVSGCDDIILPANTPVAIGYQGDEALGFTTGTISSGATGIIQQQLNFIKMEFVPQYP